MALTPNPSGKGRPLVDVPLTNVLGGTRLKSRHNLGEQQWK